MLPISLRPYAGLADIPALLAVHDACRERDRIDPYSVCYRLPNLTAEQYAAQITIPEATFLACIGEEVIAHGFMEVWGIEERLYLWQVWVKPEWRGQGIGTLLHQWGEATARRLHGNDPRPALHLANATEHEQDAVELLHQEGYHLSFISPELAFDAFENLSPRTVPGIEILPTDTGNARQIARALCEANLNEERWTEEALQARIDLEEGEWLERVAQSDPSLSFAAYDGAEIAGAYLCRRKDNVGEIAQVAVRSPWRGRGIARALAMQSLRALHEAGCKTARLFTSMGPEETEPTTGPYAMYRKFGFYPIARHLRFRKRMHLES